MPQFPVPDNKRAQKHVAGETIVVGDWIYRPAAGTDYMMIIDAVGEGTHEDMPIYLFTGDVYRMQGEGAGPNPTFLGDMEAHSTGRGEWKLPKDQRVTVACSLEDADYQP